MGYKAMKEMKQDILKDLARVMYGDIELPIKELDTDDLFYTWRWSTTRYKPGKLVKPVFVPVSDLMGKTISSIRGAVKDNDVILFECTDGSMYLMWHEQDCCECVDIDDICGDINRLIGTPITKAEEVTDSYGDCDNDESYTWTFYHFATVKGYVTLKWYGSSNGYYSESVDFCKIK